MFVYDFKNFSTAVFLHFFPNSSISETLQLLVALKEFAAANANANANANSCNVVARVCKNMLVKIFGCSKHFTEASPLYHVSNNMGIYYMCRLSNHFHGDVLLCCRDSVFVRSPIDDYSIFDTVDDNDKFYRRNLVLENSFSRFCYMDHSRYVGICNDDANIDVVLKGFQHKHVPRFQIELLKELFKRKFEFCDDFDFERECCNILMSLSCKDVLPLTFVAGCSKRRHLFFNRLEDDLFVFNVDDDDDDDLEAKSGGGVRNVKYCKGLRFEEYLKCIRRGLIEHPLCKRVLKISDVSVVLKRFEEYCKYFMHTESNQCRTNLTGSFVYSKEFLYAEYGAISCSET